MRFFVKLAASTVGVLCTTASAYFLVDEKKRHGVLFAATTVPTSDGSTPSTPIRSTGQWNWNWDGSVDR